MESDFNGLPLGQMIVDKVNQAYPGYEMTVQVRKEDGVKCVPLREIMRLGNKLPAPYAGNYPWGNGQNLTSKVRNIIEKKTSADPYHAICMKITQHWGKGTGTELVELEKDMPIIIMQLSKFPPVYEIINDLGAFIKERTGGDGDDDDDGVPGDTSVNSLSTQFAELRPGCRIRTTMEKPQRVHAIDFVMVVAGQSYNAASNMITRRIQDCSTASINGRETKVLTFDQCLDLIDQLVSPEALQFKKKCRDILKRYFAGDMSLADEIRANAQSDNPLARACRAELAAEGAGAMVPMEIDDDDKDIKQVHKATKLDQATVHRISSLLGSLKEIDPNIKATPEVAHMLNEWQNRTVAEALRINTIPQPKSITSPKPAAMQQPNVSEEMEMRDGSEEQSAGAPPPPSGVAPAINLENMFTVGIWLQENNIIVTDKVAQRIGRDFAALIRKKFPNEMRFKKSVDSTGREHLHYDRAYECFLEEVYKSVMDEENEKTARQPPPAPASAQKPPPPTQKDVDKLWRSKGKQ